MEENKNTEIKNEEKGSGFVVALIGIGVAAIMAHAFYLYGKNSELKSEISELKMLNSKIEKERTKALSTDYVKENIKLHKALDELIDIHNNRNSCDSKIVILNDE